MNPYRDSYSCNILKHYTTFRMTGLFLSRENMRKHWLMRIGLSGADGYPSRSRRFRKLNKQRRKQKHM